MRRPLIMLAFLLVTTCAVGPASQATPMRSAPSPYRALVHRWTSVPIGEEAAVRSPLYGAPEATAECELPLVWTGDWTDQKNYLSAVSACLDRIWAREFEKVNVFFTKPRREFVLERVHDPQCGTMPVAGAEGTYCGATSTYYVLVGGDGLWPWSRAEAAQVVAHEYGHHVQYLTNITDYRDFALESAKRSAADLLSRRLELQAECLSGVAIRAMERTMPPWEQFEGLYSGTLARRWVRDHGRLSTQLLWMERGFRSGRPGACTTWTSLKSEVT
ncbi:neutral zinc metallopeptidase [Microbispora sp. ATCC PTA-5024]|uniref:neutral zinc metallopeptidase n=1 Tax=Microbispora sp. ATCC PTA-5024 TaxID=316330 RepID=UPI0003DD1F6D|nr:neutral zinc metallopeptidase [Microbispora sp. ATCC PTA-5024]ETK34810.1 hypothetical protein MPTA5024_17400 [Microbispora sp. ATCC PTA-5024]